MTTVTVTDKQISFEGHAGSRDVCISLSTLSQGIASLIGWQEHKEAGLHVVDMDLSENVNPLDILDLALRIIGQLSEQYPENVKLVDAR